MKSHPFLLSQNATIFLFKWYLHSYSPKRWPSSNHCHAGLNFAQFQNIWLQYKISHYLWLSYFFIINYTRASAFEEVKCIINCLLYVSMQVERSHSQLPYILLKFLLQWVAQVKSLQTHHKTHLAEKSTVKGYVFFKKTYLNILIILYYILSLFCIDKVIGMIP